MDQKRLMELFDEFNRLREQEAWRTDRARLKILLFCLYELIRSRGPTILHDHNDPDDARRFDQAFSYLIDGVPSVGGSTT